MLLYFYARRDIMENDIMTISQAATYLQVCQKTVRRLIDSKKLVASKVGNTWRIKKADIEKYLDQARVDGQNLRCLAEHPGISLNHHTPKLGIRLVLPCRVFTHLAVDTAEHFGQLLQFIQKLQFFRVYGAADREGHIHGVAEFGDAQVQAGLHQAGHILAPGLDAIGRAAEQTDDLGGSFSSQGIAAQSIHIEGLDRCLGLVILLTDLCLQFFCNAVDPLQTNAHSDKIGLAGPGNRIVHLLIKFQRVKFSVWFFKCV